jgi:hypothetical protein
MDSVDDLVTKFEVQLGPMEPAGQVDRYSVVELASGKAGTDGPCSDVGVG